MQTINSQFLGDNDDEKQTNLNASIRERLRSKVRGKKVRKCSPSNLSFANISSQRFSCEIYI